MHRKYSTRPIVTIAYVSEMSSSSDIIPAEVERLQGIAARQFRQLGGTSTDPLVRIIFGNAGTGMAHGPLLAQMLAEMAENDPSIVGVVGLALNSAATADTIKALGADGLPMIAVTLTADNVPENRRSITRSTRRTGVKPRLPPDTRAVSYVFPET